MRDFPARPFYLIRHGESFANLRNYPAGRMDSRLTAKGRQQAKQMSEQFLHHVKCSDFRPARIIASPLKRARDTALILREGMSLPIVYDRHISEQYYGRDQGRNKTTIKRDRGRDWHLCPDAGEHADRFYRRVLTRLAFWLNSEKTLPAFVCHGGVFKALQSQGMIRPDFMAGNCTAVLFTPKKQGRFVYWRYCEL